MIRGALTRGLSGPPTTRAISACSAAPSACTSRSSSVTLSGSMPRACARATASARLTPSAQSQTMSSEESRRWNTPRSRGQRYQRTKPAPRSEPAHGSAPPRRCRRPTAPNWIRQSWNPRSAPADSFRAPDPLACLLESLLHGGRIYRVHASLTIRGTFAAADNCLSSEALARQRVTKASGRTPPGKW